MMHRLLSIILWIVTASCAAGPAPALAATVPVTPATYLTALAAAQAGDVLTAAPGAYPSATIANRTFAPPVTLSAPATAVFGQLNLRNVDGFATVGGSFSGNTLYGIALDHVRNVTIDHALLSNERTGIAASYAVGLTITGFECLGLGQDCIDLYASQNVKVLHGLVHGGVTRDGAHPDGVQMRSDVGTPMLAYIVVAYNAFVGPTAGVDMYGNKVPAVGIDVEGNWGAISEPALVSLLGPGCTGCSIVNNHADWIRGSAHIVNVVPIAPGPGYTGTISGNTVSARPAALPQ